MKPPSRRVLWWALPSGVVVASAVTIVVVWLTVTSRAVAQVQIAWEPGLSACTGNALGRAPHDMGFHGPMLYVRRGTRCTLAVQITNYSTHAVRIDSVTADLFGKHAGSILRAVNSSGNTGFGTDAQWVIGHTVAPDATYRFQLSFAYRPSGCSQAYTALENFPAVHLTVWHRGFRRTGSTALRWVQRGGSPGCRRAAAEN